MRRPGRRLLPQGNVPWGVFFVSLSIAVVVTGTAPAPVQPVGLVALYVIPGDRGEEAWVGTFGAQGGPPESKPVRLGPMGLVAQTNALVTRRRTWQATLGGMVLWGAAGRIVGRMKVPEGMTMLSLGWSGGSLYGMESSLRGGPLALVRFDGYHDRRVGQVPAGIASLWPSANAGPKVSVIEENDVTWYGHDGTEASKTLHHVAASFWVGYRGNQGLVAYSQGPRRFGWAWLNFRSIQRITTMDPKRAVLGVIDASPLWGFGVFGVVPWDHQHFEFDRVRRWPGSMPTTITLVENGGPWSLILGGAGQGYWFDADGGHFGARFRLQLPTRAIIRQLGMAIRP